MAKENNRDMATETGEENPPAARPMPPCSPDRRDHHARAANFLLGWDYHEGGLKKRPAAFEGECVSKTISVPVSGKKPGDPSYVGSAESTYNLLLMPLGIDCAQAVENGRKNEGGVRIYSAPSVKKSDEPSLLVMDIPSFMNVCAAFGYDPIKRGPVPDREETQGLLEEARSNHPADFWRNRIAQAARKIEEERNRGL